MLPESIFVGPSTRVSSVPPNTSTPHLDGHLDYWVVERCGGGDNSRMGRGAGSVPGNQVDPLQRKVQFLAVAW